MSRSCSGVVFFVTWYKLRHGVWHFWQGVVSWELGCPTSASGMPTHRQKCVTRSLCCSAALYVPLSCAPMIRRRVIAVSDFGRPNADMARGCAVGISPSGTGTFAVLWWGMVSWWGCWVLLSAVEGTAVSGASIGGVCDGCHWNIFAGAQKSHGMELVWSPHSRLIAWPLANHIGRLCGLLLPMPPRI